VIGELRKIVDDGLEEHLESLREEQHERAATFLIQWVSENVTKRPLPDLPQRVESFSKDIRYMCQEMRIKMEKGTFVVKVNGSAEQTLKKLRLGTDWFPPCEDVETIIMAGLDVQFGS
jgi:GTP cyclohydrolase I